MPFIDYANFLLYNELFYVHNFNFSTHYEKNHYEKIIIENNKQTAFFQFNNLFSTNPQNVFAI